MTTAVMFSCLVIVSAETLSAAFQQGLEAEFFQFGFPSQCLRHFACYLAPAPSEEHIVPAAAVTAAATPGVQHTSLAFDVTTCRSVSPPSPCIPCVERSHRRRRQVLIPGPHLCGLFWTSASPPAVALSECSVDSGHQWVRHRVPPSLLSDSGDVSRLSIFSPAGLHSRDRL